MRKLLDVRRFIPPYFIDKATGGDVRQVDALPDAIYAAIVYGANEEMAQALSEIRERERLQRLTLLGEAAMELLRDLRAYSLPQALTNQGKKR